MPAKELGWDNIGSRYVCPIILEVRFNPQFGTSQTQNFEIREFGVVTRTQH